jgi:tetratricopeptide (TPR) repeat protein
MMRGLLLFFVFVTSFLNAQEPFQYTEAQIAVQDKYVEAKKYALIGRFEKAQEILTELYKEDRANAAIAMELSKVYSYLDDPYNEHKFAQKAKESDPNNEYVLANYAAICLDQEKFDEAIPLLKTLVIKQPTNEEYTDKLATAFLQTNNSDAAISAYNAIESKIGVTESVSRRKYEIYEILNKDKNALEELIKVSAAFPYEVRYLHNIASYYVKLGKEGQAQETYNKILTIDINDVEANRAITLAKSGGGDDNTYLRSLTPVIENKSIPVDRKILELVPFVDQLNQKYDKELADALVMLSDRIATIHVDEAKAHALKGDILMSTNNVKGAAKAYEKTISLNDNVYSVWEGLLEAYTEIEDIVKMKITATNALDLFPNQPSAYMYYGRAYTLSNDAEEAIDLLEEGLLVSGRDVTSKSNIYAELGRAYLFNKNSAKANENIEKSLKISNNQNGLALEIKGDIYFANADTDQAIESWSCAVKAGIQSKRLQQKIDSKGL